MNNYISILNRSQIQERLEKINRDLDFIIMDEKISDQFKIHNENIIYLSEPEASKNIHGVEILCKRLLDLKIERNSTIWCVGGGALSDLVGFVASIILRGVKWNIVPTTLLSMVDASIGGKTAINLEQGKNLLGSFHLPSEILICIDFLNSLPKDELMSGKGEIIKYAFLNQKIELMIMNEPENLLEIIKECADYKNKITSNDLHEQGDRIYLNLGHTLGHGIEKLCGLPHGMSILLGMKMLFKAFKQDSNLKRLNDLIERFKVDLPRLNDLDLQDREKFWRLVSHDKKMQSQKIRLVLVNNDGPYLKHVLLDDLISMVDFHD